MNLPNVTRLVASALADSDFLHEVGAAGAPFLTPAARRAFSEPAPSIAPLPRNPATAATALCPSCAGSGVQICNVVTPYDYDERPCGDCTRGIATGDLAVVLNLRADLLKMYDRIDAMRINPAVDGELRDLADMIHDAMNDCLDSGAIWTLRTERECVA